MQRAIKYLIGDATNPVLQHENNFMCIVHSCNDIGAWGSGFVVALSKKWKEPEQQYLSWFKSKKKPVLGDVQHVVVAPNLFVANIIGQKGIRGPNNTKPVRYYAIRKGLKTLLTQLPSRTEFHMPRMGCDRGGGEWSEIEKILTEVLLPNHEVVVYDLELKS